MNGAQHNRKKALLFYWATANGPQTVADQIRSICSAPGYSFDLFNLNYDNPGRRHALRRLLLLLRKRKLNPYDLIIFHNTASYNIDMLISAFKFFDLDFADVDSRKILFKQDEMIHVNKTKAFIKRYKIHDLFTCIPENQIEKVYPRSAFPYLKIHHMITGYLNDALINHPLKPLEKRAIDISYRGMKPPPEWGKLSYEKYSIAQDFLDRAQQAKLNLRLDISADPLLRIGKEDWFHFLENSRACLAVESGASIFDFDGSVQNNCRQYRLLNPEAEFEDYQRDVLAPFENNIIYNQVSPRHLEAAALGTALIMFEGTYSDIFKAHVNYIPLKKDFSNFDEVIKQFLDSSRLENIVQTNKMMIRKDERVHESTFLKLVHSTFP